MRLLYVIDSLADGGAETSLAHVAGAYRTVGIDLHVAFLKARWDVAEALRESGATLHPVALDADRLRHLASLTRLIRRLDPDVVHTTLYDADVLGRVAARLAGRPVVTTFANSSYSDEHYADPCVDPRKLRAAQVVDAATARLAAGFHAVSAAIADDMAQRLHVPRDRMTVVPRSRSRAALGYSSPERRSRVRETLGLADAKPLVLAVGRHEHQKGLDVLVAAADLLRRDVPEVRVMVAGREGRQSAALRAAIASHGLDDAVELLGARTDVPDLIVAADVVVVASRFEGLPGAVLEAMALDTPVVASDIPMVREAIGEHAYALVPVSDPAALAEGLQRCLQDPARADVASSARARFEQRYTPDAVAAQMRQFYDSVAGQT